jgi:sigma-B regulation protein RsbU (phosphoserine phosphatase)
MRILIADDDAALRVGLRVQLQRWGYEPVVCGDGDAARAVMLGPDPPPVAVIDWSMPGVDGLTLSAELRRRSDLTPTYIIMLTARDTLDEMVAGLDGGADEYITKPFDWGLLRARVRIGVRIATLQQSLAQRVRELQAALDTVKVLSGLLPMCSYCKRIRNDENYWQQLETYLSEHTDAEFSHGVCPGCLDRAKKDLGV